MNRARTITAVLAAFYLLVAIAAVVLAPRSLAHAYTENMVAGFGVDAILTIVHAVIGVAALIVTLKAFPVVRRVFGMAVGVACLGLFAYGIPAAIDPNPDAGFNIGWGNVVVYALTMVAGFYVAFEQSAHEDRPVLASDSER
ncbi:DUF4383 domain-containing protein [Thermocrispum agreste]|uniref:DUF4383 domain-containing protein n=1 Tax=Thermocrispum agreste TaxID=37925 RepID=UPI00048B0EA0|nr:DUF4383 domain-containing protein [Thermocrispum agreste]